MGNWVVVGFVVLMAFAIISLVRAKMRAGPVEVGDDVLARARSLLRVTAESPEPGWQQLGSLTRADGLRLRFDHDDDPQAEATLPVADEIPRNTLSNTRTIRLAPELTDEHVHTGGYVFRVRLRGTGSVIGKQVRLKMLIDGENRPVGGRIENDDDTDAAVGDWIEIERAEVLEIVGET